MKFVKLDTIVRSILLQKSLPLHWYLQFLKYSADALRELTLDTLQIVNTVELPVDTSDFTCQIPCDYVDYTGVGVKKGQFVRPIPQIDTINNLPATQPNGVPTTYGVVGEVEISDSFPLWPGAFVFQNIDDLGENLGRLFGWPSDNRTNGFKIIPERGVIQLTESFQYSSIIFQYISDGQCVDNASQVPVYAQKTIEAYDDREWKTHTGRHSLGEITMADRMHTREWRKLRARISGLTISDIKQSIWHAYQATNKN
jgi:hypothetical protein